MWEEDLRYTNWFSIFSDKDVTTDVDLEYDVR